MIKNSGYGYGKETARHSRHWRKSGRKMFRAKSIGIHFENAKAFNKCKCVKEFCALLKNTEWLKNYNQETIQQAFSHYKNDALAGLEIKYRMMKACMEILKKDEIKK